LTLKEAVQTVVAFVGSGQDLDRPLYALAIEAFQQKWPCASDSQ
jgi:hypothetical protein